jgi:hypothetical protein
VFYLRLPGLCAKEEVMGFFIRKPIRFGPIRFNLSNWGIGASVGVKGARLGVRPNGTPYVYGGRNGLYYRQNLGGQPRPSGTSKGLAVALGILGVIALAVVLPVLFVGLFFLSLIGIFASVAKPRRRGKFGAWS